MLYGRLVKEQINAEGDDLLGSLELNSSSDKSEEEETEQTGKTLDELTLIPDRRQSSSEVLLWFKHCQRLAG